MLIEGEVDSVLAETKEHLSGFPGPRLRLGKCFVNRHIDALHRGGEHASGMQIILVAVATDAEPAGVFRRLHYTEPRGSSGMKNHVGTATELTLGEFGPLGRIAPSSGRRAGHVLKNFGLGIHVAHAFHVTERKFADERNIHSADEANFTGLRNHRRGHPAKK